MDKSANPLPIEVTSLEEAPNTAVKELSISDQLPFASPKPNSAGDWTTPLLKQTIVW